MAFPFDRHSRPALRPIRNENCLRDDENTLGKRIVSDPLPKKPSKFLLKSVESKPTLRAFSLNATNKPLANTQIPSKREPSCFAQREISKSTHETRPRSAPQVDLDSRKPDLSPLSTSLLQPQTLKSAGGQITVLPQSRNLLIDFREGERRRGRKGNQVLVVSCDGEKIMIFPAPHLSTPCCLAEPEHTYTRQNLPLDYWKLYNDAAGLVEQLKEKTPHMVIFTDAAKCSLMANGPLADIEITMQQNSGVSSSGSCFDNSESSKSKKNISKQPPSLRLRLKSSSLSLEIARYFNSELGNTESVKKTRSLTDWTFSSWETLTRSSFIADDEERRAVSILRSFISTCDALERHIDSVSQEDVPRPSSVPDFSFRERQTAASSKITGKENEPDSPPRSLSRFSAAKKFAASRRPVSSAPSLIFASPLPSNTTPQNATATLSSHFSPEIETPKASFSAIRSAKNNNTEVKSSAVQTRFINGVGWCIRHGSRVSQGGRYKIMFVDGAELEVDADEEWVEFLDGDGDLSRLDIKDCAANRKIGDRLKAFAEFVSMFDDDES